MRDFQDPTQKDSLTLREIEVLGLIATGLTNQEISQKLFISPETVKWYAKQIYPKLGVSNRTQAALKADEIGLINFGKDSPEKSGRLGKLGNLPAQLTSCIGRKKEIAEIKHLLDSNRLLTLTGSGGTGKTRLALEVANQMLKSFRYGVWFVDLSPISDPAQVINHIAHTLKIESGGETSLEKALTGYLKSKHLMIVMDNFEHLLKAAPMVGNLLTSAPELTILVTSREPIHVSGEQEYIVGPLPLPDLQQRFSKDTLLEYDAINLFVQRAFAAQPKLDFSEEDIQAIARICTRLDGLPLAIELAAPQLKIFSVGKLANRLYDNLEFLPSGPRNLPERQQTLRATLEWSYELLNENEQLLFTHLAVFRSGGAIDAIEYLCKKQVKGNIINLLISLVNKNLLVPIEQRDGEIYFSMLETTRELVQEFLDAQENKEKIYKQFVEYYANMANCAANEYSSPNHTYWFIRIQVEQENFRAAFDWAVKHNEAELSLQIASSLRNYWRNYGLQNEGLDWANTAIDMAKEDHLLLQAKALLAAGDYCGDLVLIEKARDYLSKALEIFHKFEDQQNAARALALLGFVSMDSLEDIQQGIDRALESIDMFRRLKDKGGLAHTFNMIAELYRMAGDLETAENYYLKCLELTKETGERLREGSQYANLGLVAYLKKDYLQAEKLTKMGLEIFLEMDAYYGIYYDLGGLAGAALGLGNPKRAARLMGASNAGMEILETTHQQSDKIVINQIIDELQNVLDEETLRALWEEGQNMTVQEAFDYALNDSAIKSRKAQ
jgi:non-specific serine/threonine protein kinase